MGLNWDKDKRRRLGRLGEIAYPRSRFLTDSDLDLRGPICPQWSKKHLRKIADSAAAGWSEGIRKRFPGKRYS